MIRVALHLADDLIDGPGHRDLGAEEIGIDPDRFETTRRGAALFR